MASQQLHGNQANVMFSVFSEIAETRIYNGETIDSVEATLYFIYVAGKQTKKTDHVAILIWQLPHTMKSSLHQNKSVAM